ncbi:Prolyl oligopeptidase family protein [Actinacidiphila yanglinensis]|uniref:Prolyl oligopeptidase family protein n=1 Tax=Actinacidiphila yanglinensis TaxID=310779 RepID=A0A1H6DWM6_9ACTN|nr:alpha/beta hydrolase [Actinacidiphila yanglinensis]SEG89658.1 Prolyl oligopeptidase family protein [Actinacidiphila yanglinensis]
MTELLDGRLTVHLAPGTATDQAPGPAPIVLVLPGGGYNVHAPHEAEPVARWLGGIGLHAAVLRYRLRPQGSTAPLDDARAAVRALREGAAGPRVDASRVGVLGFSAGGHLAAWLAGGPQADEVERPDLAVLCYPLISMAHLPHPGSLEALLGTDAGPDERRAASMEYAVDPATPPVFCWHTAEDGAVDVEHALRYTTALRRAGVPLELHVLPHGAHGLGLAQENPYAARWTGWCAEWFALQGWR